ncbi:DNA repair exonuclease SbcCD nuclease subunit [Alkalibacillus filiformis]|uniref:DNA repair exonuclease SbcCD nuclease subunit n=1 Tax=Alkalibacillus filiformis TaxID=200990 RepID=A0ABU0DT93_9BACI|nr:DNA repair exonuclease [Alkalibacillus filiformis]MDQ0351661.1 DNA repair exonuclease SbcCD nuclease subunit [Alkalibacillus filiformis]
MHQSVRFLHSADLHLDSPYKGMRHLPGNILTDVKASTFKAFRRLIDLAIEQQVDFVLLVGDLFDQDSASLKSLVALKDGLKKLEQHNIKAFISFGNHDYQMLKKVDLTFPSNTYVFTQQDVTSFPFEKDGEILADIHGFSYESRAVTESKVHEYSPVSNDRFQIATLHGSSKTNNEHDQYAPFLLEQLKATPFDYWALGHIHKREILSYQPYIVYPGNIQGRHIKETGEKGCYIVDLSQNQTQIQFHQLQDILFVEEELTFMNCTAFDELVEQLKAYKDRLRHESGKVWIRITVFVQDHLRQYEEELLHLLNEGENDEEDWVWIQSLKLDQVVQYDRKQLKQSNQFVGEVIKMMDETDDSKRYLDDLLNNRHFKQQIGTLTKQDLEQIEVEAEQLIIEKLLKDGRD